MRRTPDLAVLDHQLRGQEPLAPDEHADMVAYDADGTLGCARAPESATRFRADWSCVSCDRGPPRRLL